MIRKNDEANPQAGGMTAKKFAGLIGLMVFVMTSSVYLSKAQPEAETASKGSLIEAVKAKAAQGIEQTKMESASF